MWLARLGLGAADPGWGSTRFVWLAARRGLRGWRLDMAGPFDVADVTSVPGPVDMAGPVGPNDADSSMQLARLTWLAWLTVLRSCLGGLCRK